MRYFKLPDLGEGLIEADIVEWYIKAGDAVVSDQIMLTVETAKAIVEIPSPQMGIIEHIFGAVGDTVHIGEPLVEYQGENDSMSIVGNLSAQPLAKSGTPKPELASPRVALGFANTVKALQVSPSVRGLASRLNVDVEQLTGTAEGGRISAEDVEKAAYLNHQHGEGETLTGVRKAMAKVMINSHQQVVPVSLFGDAAVNDQVLKSTPSITILMTQAIAYACTQEPALNVWFDGENLTRRLLNFVDVGIAVDTEQGLFVPVLRQVQARSEDDLVAGLAALKEAVIKRNIPPSELTGATIILSNYGALNDICRYGTPIVVPPMVAIVGIGARYGDDGHQQLPLSLTFDHRCVTGGEAARFMAKLVEYLQSI